MVRADLLKLGGACAVLYTAVVVSAIVLLAIAGLLEAVDASEVLPILNERHTVVLTAGWLFVLAPIVLAIASLGFFMAFRGAGSVVWLALPAFLMGSMLALLRTVIWLAMTYELAPAYAEATEAGRETLASVGDTLISIGFIAGDQLGGVLVAGVGVPLFSAGVLRTEVAANWIGWLGFPAAVFGGWFVLFGSVAELFEVVSLVGSIGFLVWMIALGVVLWRMDPVEEV